MKIIILFSLFISFLSYGKNYEIKMFNKKDNKAMIFSPAFLKINPNDKVTFIPINKGHNTRSVFTPKSGQTWKGKNNQKVQVEFTKEGLYLYECSNHGIMGMIGIIQVGSAKNKNEFKKFISSYKEKIIMNKKRLEDLVGRVGEE